MFPRLKDSLCLFNGRHRHIPMLTYPLHIHGRDEHEMKKKKVSSMISSPQHEDQEEMEDSLELGSYGQKDVYYRRPFIQVVAPLVTAIPHSVH